MKFLSYFFKKTTTPIEIEMQPMGGSAPNSSRICCIDSFRKARDSFDLYRSKSVSRFSGYSSSISMNSSWFWRDSEEKGSLTAPGSDSSGESTLILASRGVVATVNRKAK